VSPSELADVHTEVLISRDTIHNHGTSFALVERSGILGMYGSIFAVSPAFVSCLDERQNGDQGIIPMVST
jgi:hypothetical protein